METKQPRRSAMPVLNRVLRYMLRSYWPLFLLVICCILASAVATVVAATFPQTLVDDYITPMLNGQLDDFSGLCLLYTSPSPRD